jgi:signal transduction histidine kinase
MAISYVLVTGAAVAVVEIIGIVLVVPGLLAGARKDTDPSLVVQLTARNLADDITRGTLASGRLPTPDEKRLGEPGLWPVPGQAVPGPDKASVRIPYIAAPVDETRPVSLALLLDPDGRIVLSSYPAHYRVGTQFGNDGVGVVVLPPGVLAKVRENLKFGGGGEGRTSTGNVYWAIAPALLVTNGNGKPELAGFVYVQVPADPKLPDVANRISPADWWDPIGAQLGAGLLVLLVALPVGVVFGLLSTRSLIGRLRRLAASTVAVADGDYAYRVSVSGADEVGQLETNFNRMAERLTDAMAAERQVAGANERARIARELHDSISQDLFSLRLLAGGLRRALPADSPLYRRAEAMERTATGTMQEMQALMLELRPVALTDAGLVPTLDELSQAYRDRLGIAVDAELEPVEMHPEVEHAVLRIVQEALTNAVKHGWPPAAERGEARGSSGQLPASTARPSRLTLRIQADGDHVAVSVGDNGSGFDPSRAAERHGLGLELIRDRVAALGGEFRLDSAVGEGTTLRIRLPRGRP